MPNIKKSVKITVLTDLINAINHQKQRHSLSSNKDYQLFRAQLNLNKIVSENQQIETLFELLNLLTFKRDKKSIALFKSLCLLEISNPKSGLITGERVYNYRDDMQLITRCIAFYYYASLLISTEYIDSDQANNDRFEFARLNKILQYKISEKLESELYAEISQILALVGNEYADLIDDLKPISRLTLKKVMTSLSLSWDIYQNPTMAADLLERNHIASGSFLPPQIQYREI